MGKIITLTTDFGLDDGYVGTIKGAILSINPSAVMVDLCHNVAPQDVGEAAFILGTSTRYFPRESIHLGVVDPGVGGQRRAIIIQSAEGTFVGPDNGVLTWAASGAFYPRQDDGRSPSRWLMVNLSNPRFWLPRVSRTFHARDIFAPVVAHLSLGTSPKEFGEVIDRVVRLPWPRPAEIGPASLVAHVVHVDRFGNLITDLAESDVQRLGGDVVLEIGGQTIRGLSGYYAERDGLLGLVGSSGLVEIALRNGSAAQFLGAAKGGNVVVSARSEGRHG